MKLKWILSTAIIMLICMVPAQVLAAAAENGDEAASSEPSGLLVVSLTILSIVTMIYLIYLEIRDNG
ncbi:hypothetical protein [Halalkalibacter sp. APA_J-10(15)]|uniref:hypothetical protein n=1 Tax=unclassified Halalkalibacter TaxID=2893063 RepID=UPI001FF6AD4F|nr:hypothetical protein [Halalkalibacter sp. APA_J-10(15)]MCK0472069.1 hypothetical protein [Halalkalibacter sp. APA_J-10(15)]